MPTGTEAAWIDTIATTITRAGVITVIEVTAGAMIKNPVSLNLILGVSPEIPSKYRCIAGGIVGARQAKIEGLSEGDLRWRENYGGMVGLLIRRFFIGARWTTEGWGTAIGIGTVNRRVISYGLGGEKMGDIGGAGTMLKEPVLIGGDIGFGGQTLPE